MELIKIENLAANQSKLKRRKKLNVAAYCRVSTKEEMQKTSFDTQVKVYTDRISANPDWKFAGIYSDDGKSGTRKEHRDGFNNLIRDCKRGKIDLILTKSISRFARNTLDCISTVRNLKSLGVGIIFEENNLDTRTAFSEMVLTIYAAFAQEESHSQSENIRWGYKKRFSDGKEQWRPMYGYTTEEGKRYTIVPEQAAIVRKIFNMYVNGMSLDQIVDWLNTSGIVSYRGKTGNWSRMVVRTILGNEKYKGDSLMQKTYVTDYLDHKQVKNKEGSGVPEYYAKNHHEAIIDYETFELAQVILAMRETNKKLGGGQYPYGEFVICPHCGKPMKKSAMAVLGFAHTSGFNCEEPDCMGATVHEPAIKEAFFLAYKNLTEEQIKECDNTLADVFIDIKHQAPEIHDLTFYILYKLIDSIEFGIGEDGNCDRSIRINWKCGLTSVCWGFIASDYQPETMNMLYRLWKKDRNEYRNHPEAKHRGTQKGGRILPCEHTISVTRREF